MTTRATVRNNAYVDSVTLLQVSAEVSSLAGVLEAALVMATDLNRQVLRDSGLLAGGVDSAGPNDLVIAVRAVNEVEAALRGAPAGGHRTLAFVRAHARTTRSVRLGTPRVAFRVSTTRSECSTIQPQSYAEWSVAMSTQSCPRR